MTAPNLVQVEFRARNDDVSLNSTTFTYALNANFSQDVDVPFRVRFTIAETGGGMANNIAFSLQYNLAGAGFVAIGDTAAVRSAQSALFVNSAVTTQVISSGAFVAGAGYEQTTTSNITLQSQRTEIEWCLSIDSAQVTNGQTFTLRVVQDTGTVLQTYTQTPTITVIDSGAVNFTANTLTGTLAIAGQLAKLPGPTAVAALNTNAELDAGTTYLLRVRVENTGSAGAADFRWSYNHNSAGFLPVTTTSSAIKAVAAGSFVNDADVPEVLGGSGTYLADNNAGTEDGTTTLSAAFPGNGAVEFVLAFQIVGADVSDAQTGLIRLELGDGTDLDAYTNTLTYTVNVLAQVDFTGAPTTGSVSIAGLASTVAASSTVSPTVSALAIAGFAPVVTTDALTVPATSAIELTGLAPTVVADAALEPSLSALVISGFAPSVDAGASVSVTPELGVLELTALAPTLTAGAVLAPDVATLEVVGLAPTPSISASVEPGVASLEITGFAPSVEAAGNVTVAPTVGSLEITGLAPTVSIQQPPTAAGVLNEDIEITVDTTYLIWARVENTGAEGSTDFRWGYNHEGTGWTPVTVTVPEEDWSDGTNWSDGTGWLEAEPNKVIAVNASSFANDDDVPERLTGSGTYLTDNNSATEDGTTTLPANFPAGGAVEFVLSFRVVGVLVQNSETGQIRLERGDGTELNAYTETFTYTVSGSGAVFATPAPGILSLVGLAPTVMADVLVEPGVAQLSITGLPPTAEISHSVEPSLGAIEIIGLAPDASASATAEPSEGAIELTGAEPDASASAALLPAASALVVTGFIPTVDVAVNITLDLGAGAVEVTGFAPIVTISSSAEPSLGALEINGLAPTLSASVSVEPGAGSLEVIGLAPDVAAGVVAVLGVAALDIVGFAPAVEVSGNITVEPSAGVLFISGLAPTVAASATAEPSAGVLSITGLAPTVEVTGDVTAEPSAGVLEVVGLAPDASATAAITPNATALVVTGFAPSADVQGNITLEPGVGNLEVVGFAPDAYGSAFTLLAPNTILATTNLQDTLNNIPPLRLADIDEPTGSDDGEWWTAVDNGLDTEGRLGFPMAPGTLVSTQTLRVLVRATTLPSRNVTVELWENGSKLTSETTEAVTSTTGQVVTLTFDKSELVDETGADLEVHILSEAA